MLVSARRGHLRVSTHFYNNEQDLEALREASPPLMAGTIVISAPSGTGVAEPFEIAYVFVAHEDVDMLADLALFGSPGDRASRDTATTAPGEPRATCRGTHRFPPSSVRRYKRAAGLECGK